MESALNDHLRNHADDTEILSSQKEALKSNDIVSHTMVDKRNSLGICSPHTIQEEVANDLRHRNLVAETLNSQQNINSGQELTLK
jgi:hypothetical protein